MKQSTFLIKTLIYTSVFVFVLSGLAQAAVLFNSSLGASESYNDNIFFDSQNKVDDLITTVSPAFSLGYVGKDISLSIGYRGRALFYAENTAQNDFFHALSIDLDLPILNRQIRGVEVQVIEEMSFSPELPGFSFLEGNDQKAQARAQRLPQGMGQGVQLRKTDTFQNQAGISLSYNWTERINTTGQYTNVITRFSGSQFEDREAHFSTFGASYQYPFSLRTTLTNSYGLAITTGDAQDRVIHTLNFQLAHNISPTLSATAGFGMSYIKDNTSPKAIYSAGLTKVFQNGGLSIQYTDNVSSGLGVIRDVTRRQRVIGTANYGLGEWTGIYLQGSYSSNQSIAGNEIDIVSYTALTGISTQFLSWLTASLNYSYLRQDTKGGANVFGKDGERNLVSVQFTASGTPWRIIK